MSPQPTEDLSIHETGPEWDARWDCLAGSCVASGFMQSSAWSDFKRREGYRVRRLGLFRRAELLGGGAFMAYGAGAPGADRGQVVICPEGPVLPWEDIDTCRGALRMMAGWARDHWPEAVALRIEPHLPPPRPSLLRNWSRAPADLTPTHTLVVDLNLADEELLAQMSPKGRYNVRVAHRHGVSLRRSSSPAEIAAFYVLFDETARRQAFYAEPYGFFVNLASAMFARGAAELTFAEREGRRLAAILVVYFGRRATYLYGGSSADERYVMPMYAAHWAAMQAARERGCVEYDLYGYDPFGIPDHQYSGISRFKRQFGGERRDSMGAHDLVFYERLADLVVGQLKEGAAD